MSRARTSWQLETLGCSGETGLLLGVGIERGSPATPRPHDPASEAHPSAVAAQASRDPRASPRHDT